MRHTLPFRLSKEQHTIMRVLAVFAVLAALIANGLAVIPGPTPAQAQTQTIPVSPTKRDFTKLKAYPDPTFEFTVGADATVTSLEFSMTGDNFVQGYTLTVNGKSLTPQFTQSDGTRKNPTITHDGLNISVKKGDLVKLTPDFTVRSGTVSGSVSVTLRGTPSGTTTPPTDPDPTPDPTTVTPAAPTAVDPATASQCVEKGYINIPGTQGVDYYIEDQKKSAGQHFFEGTKPATVKVTAKAQSGYQIASGAQTEWSFNMSGQVKSCSGDPTPPPDGRTFKATGHGFSLQGDPVDPNRPDTFTAKVGEDAKLNYITVRIKTDATFLDPQHYQLTVDKIEDGVTLQKRNVNIGNGYITMDVVPMKDGKQVDSAFLPKDAVFTFTNNLAKNKSLVVELDAYGAKATDPTDPPIISPPDGADWVNGRVANPQIPMSCGLRIAVVADLSTSLRYADVNGFEATKTATNAFIDALTGTPAELGIYNFASSAPANGAGSTAGNNPPYISMQTTAGVNKAKRVVENWAYNSNNSATNWEAGLKQVKDHGYDVVYFITDGMPTTSSTIKSKGIGGEFVQASALNDAIKAANELKTQGTRVVPLMVELELGGYTGERWPVKEDYVLKDVTRIPLEGSIPQEKGTFFRINSGIEAANRANYIGTKNATDPANGAYTLVNLKAAMDAVQRSAVRQPIEVYEKATSSAAPKRITFDQSKWTYGTRTVTQMGEDISGTGNTVPIKGYRDLTAQMTKIAQELTSHCKVTVKKRIVDENGEVLSDGEPGWEFTLTTDSKAIELDNGELVRQSLKATSNAAGVRGTASWNIKSETSQKLTLVETQQQGYSLYQRGGKNAVCHETSNGETKPIEVGNVGKFGFTVNMSAKEKKLPRVSCVVDNYKTPETQPGKLTFKKAQYVDGEIVEMPRLGEATFEIYPAKYGKPDYSAGKPLYTINADQESIDVKTTGTFFLVETKAPEGLNLLPRPVSFQISLDQKTNKYKISSDSGHVRIRDENKAMILTVVDTASGELPKTGGNGVAWWAAGGMAIAAAGALLMYRRRA